MASSKPENLSQKEMLDVIRVAERKIYSVQQSLMETLQNLAPAIYNSIEPQFENLKVSLNNAKDNIIELEEKETVSTTTTLYPDLDILNDPPLLRTHRMPYQSGYDIQDVLKDYYAQIKLTQECIVKNKVTEKQNQAVSNLTQAIQALRLS